MPNALPPIPPIRQDRELGNLLAQATLAIGRLDGAIEILPNPDLFVFMYVRKEAVLSSQIEGTQSSLADLLEAEASLLDADRPADVAEVINYVNAMNYGLERLASLPVSTRLIREIHERLMSGARGAQWRPGEIRTSQNWIGPGGSTLADATFVPPPPHLVPHCLGELENFLHGETEYHELVRVALAHAQFETIHPFLDGNGRVGRLLISFLLCEKKILQKPVLYLSRYFSGNRAAYYDRLQAVRTDGDWEGWLKFFLRGVEDVALAAAATAKAIIALRESHRRRIHEAFEGRAGNAVRLVDALFQRPIMNVGEVSEVIGQTYQAANSLVGELTRLEILREITGQRRNRAFEYGAYVDLFTDRRSGR
ncbi:MAG: Fic family protein [Parvularculaceae bacterium]